MVMLRIFFAEGMGEGGGGGGGGGVILQIGVAMHDPPHQGSIEDIITL